VGRQRGAGLGGGHDEREQTLNQLLVEMDGFSANEGIIVVAATNRPDILDPALLRPGRFDREVTVDVPDVLGRRQILEVHAKGKPIDSTVDFDVVARRTPGFTGADLANVINEAALLAARHNKKTIGMMDMDAAAERVIAGPEKKSRVISDREKKLVSYHEAGHAVVAYFLPNSDPLHKISIIPRGRAGGYTLLLPKEDRRYVTKSQMLDELVIYLGGRMAEELVLKDVSTGAQNDLERATEIVRQMITRYGMSEDLGPLTFGKRTDTIFLGRDISQERNYSEAIAYAIDKEARQMIDEAYNRGKNILSENIDKLHAVAAALMEKETLQAEEFYQLMKGDQDAEVPPADDSDNGILPAPDSNVQAAPWPAAPQPESTRPEDMSIQPANEQKEEYQRLAQKLTAQRQAAAKKLAAAITAEFKLLYMPQAIFDVQLIKREMSPCGVEKILFVIQSNPGEAFLPVAKIASGGELSRVVLAIKVILAQLDQVPTLIFDEIDSGLGGVTLDMVAKRIAKIAEYTQVMVITHAALMAAAATHHIYIYKKVHDSRTEVHCQVLDEDGRIAELSRMIAGENISQSTFEQARDLLKK
jgi:hypothetical protein